MVGLLKTKTVGKWFGSLKKNIFSGIMEKPTARITKKPVYRVSTVNASFEAIKRERIRKFEVERLKAKAIDHRRHIQYR